MNYVLPPAVSVTEIDHHNVHQGHNSPTLITVCRFYDVPTEFSACARVVKRGFKFVVPIPDD